MSTSISISEETKEENFSPADESEPNMDSVMEPMSELEILMKSYNLGMNALAGHMLEMHAQQRDFIKNEIKEQVGGAQDKILIILAKYFESLVEDYSTDLKTTHELHKIYETLMKFVVEELQIIREENRKIYQALQVIT